MGGTELAPVDYLVAGILFIAVLRGLARGLLRESFSIAARRRRVRFRGNTDSGNGEESAPG